MAGSVHTRLSTWYIFRAPASHQVTTSCPYPSQTFQDRLRVKVRVMIRVRVMVRVKASVRFRVRGRLSRINNHKIVITGDQSVRVRGRARVGDRIYRLSGG